MCGSRKYPYPTTKGFSLRRTPPPPWIFHICKELMTPPPSSPTPPEFPQSRWSLKIECGPRKVVGRSLKMVPIFCMNPVEHRMLQRT